MRIFNLVLPAAAVAAALVAVDHVAINTAGAAVSEAPAIVNRDGKGDRLSVDRASAPKVSADASIRISVDHAQGMTTVIKRAPLARTSFETDFAFLDTGSPRQF